MSVTLWLNTEREETIELGATFAVYRAFREMMDAAGEQAWDSTYGSLAGVLTVCGNQEDADSDWLADVRKQAQAFLDAHGNQVSEVAREILHDLIHGNQE